MDYSRFGPSERGVSNIGRRTHVSVQGNPAPADVR